MKQAWAVLMRGVILVVLFFSLWGHFAFACLFSLLKIYQPVWFDMLGGLCLKIKVPIDV